MPGRVDVSEGAWNDLYDFLDPLRSQKQGADRDTEAEARYQEITRKLICYFTGRGCRDAEDLAMTTILRVAARCASVDSSGYENHAGYFYGVARNVLHEAQRESAREIRLGEKLETELGRLPVPDHEAWRRKETVQHCLDRCMTGLTGRARRMLLSYYSGEGEQRIDAHRALAGELGKSVNALRIEVHRVRKSLRECVFACLQADTGGTWPGGPLPAQTAEP